MKKIPKKIPKVKSGSLAALNRECDRLWSLAIKNRDEYRCRAIKADGTRCTYIGGIHPHHIFSRTYKATRWDLDNGIGLCFIHHIRTTGEKLRDQSIRTIGQKSFDSLKEKAYAGKKWKQWELEELKDMLSAFVKQHEFIFKEVNDE